MVKGLQAKFEFDWNTSGADAEVEDSKAEKVPEAGKKETEKALAVLVKELHPVSDTVKKAVKKWRHTPEGKCCQTRLLSQR